MKKVLVTGANGFVGSALCRELVNHGYSVRGLHRKGSNLDSLKGLDIELREGDICERESLMHVMEGVNGVFHIAALFREAGHPDNQYFKVNVEGVRNVFECAIESGVKKLVHCSTVGVHSHIPSPPATEEEPYRPGDIYQETKCEGEKVAKGFFSQGQIKGGIVRPAMIWGPGDTRTLKMFRGLAQGKMPIIGSGKTLLHWILVSDLAAAFRLAYEQEYPAGEVFIISGERPIELRELFAEIAACFGRTSKLARIPAWPVQLLGSVVEKICVPLGVEPPIYRRRVDFFTKTRAFDSSKARKLLGFQPRGDVRDEIEAIANWYLEAGWIKR